MLDQGRRSSTNSTQKATLGELVRGLESLSTPRNVANRMKQRRTQLKLQARVRRLEEQISSTEALLPTLLDAEEVEKIRTEQQQLIASGGSWEDSARVIQLRDIAVEQISVIQECRIASGIADRFDDVARPFSQPAVAKLWDSTRRIRERIAGVVRTEPGEASDEINRLEAAWQAIAAALVRYRSRFHAIDALRFFSDRSGVEAGSIMVAFIVALGAIWSWSYYWTLGIRIDIYWTVEDLILIGTKFAAVGVLAFWMLGRAFTWVQGKFEVSGRLPQGTSEASPRKAFRRIVQVGPTRFLVFGSVVTAAVAGGAAHVVGEHDLRTYEPGAAIETAVLTNGKLMEGIKLIGTTARAAIFLASAEGGDGVKVVALDRAQVLCHGRNRHCDRYLEPPSVQRIVTMPASNRYDSSENEFSSVHAYARQVLGCRTMVSASKMPPRVYFDRDVSSEFCGEQVSRHQSEGGNQVCTPVAFPKPVQAQAGTLELLAIGFSSAPGGYSANYDLAERRAIAVADALQGAGWGTVRPVSLGESMFVDRNAPFDAEAADRRVEIVACDTGLTVAGVTTRAAQGL